MKRFLLLLAIALFALIVLTNPMARAAADGSTGGTAGRKILAKDPPQFKEVQRKMLNKALVVSLQANTNIADVELSQIREASENVV